MKNKYFIIVCLIILIVMLGMIGRLGYALNLQTKKDYTIITMNKEENEEKIIKKHSLVSTIIGDKTIAKPIFNDINLDKYIDDYILLNSCTNFTFKIEYLSNEIVNLKLNCGNNKENKIYNLKESKFVEFKELIKNENTFKEKVYNLLSLKYPKFVVDEVNIINSIYIINGNEINLSYHTVNYGYLNLKINNNEIKDLLKYNMKYDEYYENEKYVLDPSKKTIAFTFDDGPSEYDIEIINALKDSHATATFFIVGSRINNFQRSIFSMVENNMEVGNHSYNHKSFKKISDNDVLFQINETNNIYSSLTNKNISLLRPPYGAYRKNIFNITNMPIIMWNIDTLDWQNRNTDKIYNHILNNVSDGDIILMHSLFEPTKDAVIKVLPELYKRGYQVVSVSELANLKGINLESGKIYHSFIK